MLCACVLSVFINIENFQVSTVLSFMDIYLLHTLLDYVPLLPAGLNAVPAVPSEPGHSA